MDELVAEGVTELETPLGPSVSPALRDPCR